MSRAVAAPRPAEGRYSVVIRSSRSVVILIGLVLLSRLLAIEEGGLAYLYLPHAWVQTVPGYLPPAGPLWFQTLLGPWAHWDGYWYLSIAHLGYSGRPLATAFFPLYPIILRVLGGSVLAGFLVSNVAFLGALGVLYRVAKQEVGETAAWFTVLALAYFPSSFYFSSVYPESIMLLLGVSTVYMTRQGQFAIAGLLAGIASAASVDGLLLALPILYTLWQRRVAWWRWSSLLLVPSGLLAYMWTLYQTFQNPLTFEAVQQNWGRAFTPLWIGVWNSLTRFYMNLGAVISPEQLFATHQPVLSTSNVWNLLFMAFGIWLAVRSFRRLSLDLAVFSAVVLAIPLFYPSAGVPLMSSPRFVLASWPIFLTFGAWLSDRPRYLKSYLWIACLSGAVLVALFTTAHWVA